MKKCFIYICCEYPYNIISNLFSKIIPSFPQEKQENGQIKTYSKIDTNTENEEENNDINNPAKILSSEEINEMIKDQIKYSKEQNNSNGYKIVKQKNPEDSIKSDDLMNIEEIKKEINQIEFEEEEQKQNMKNNLNNNIDNNNKKENNEEIMDNNEEEDTNLNIEELRKDVLENNDDLD